MVVADAVEERRLLYFWKTVLSFRVGSRLVFGPLPQFAVRF